MPNTDQCTAVLTVTSPVTQLAEAAVNSASRNGVICPSAAETGSISTSAPTRIVSAKPTASTVGARSPRCRLCTIKICVCTINPLL